MLTKTLNSLGFFSIYTYKQPFGWQAFSFNIMAGYSQEDSDIDFYDESSFISRYRSNL